jgi:hypothetical protein
MSLSVNPKPNSGAFKIVSRHCYRIARLIAFVALGLAAIWGGFWIVSALRYNKVIDGWIENQKAAGYDVSFDERRLGGFPLHVLITFDNLNWKNTDAIVLHADHMALRAKLWRWNIYDAKFNGHVALTAALAGGAQSFNLSGDDGRAHVELDADGFWRLSRVTLADAQIGIEPNYLVVAKQLSASVERPDQPPKTHTETGLIVAAGANNLTLPSTVPTPFGNKMAAFAVSLRVMDNMPDFRKRESVDAWNKDSGVVEFDNLHMDWGPLNITAKGTMGFDDALQPEGAFAGALVGHEALLKALTDYGFVPARQTAMLQSALTMFAKPSKSGAPGIDMPITVQLGGIFMGPIKIFGFPEIIWPTAGTPAPNGQPTVAPLSIPQP